MTTTPPKVYIPELWIHTRAIVQEKVSGLKSRFRIRRLTLGSSKDSTTVELVPTTPHPDYPDSFVELSLTAFEESFEQVRDKVEQSIRG
jgi:hypothetical protein